MAELVVTYVRKMKKIGALLGAGSQLAYSAVPTAGCDAEMKTVRVSLLVPYTSPGVCKHTCQA